MPMFKARSGVDSEIQSSFNEARIFLKLPMIWSLIFCSLFDKFHLQDMSPSNVAHASYLAQDALRTDKDAV